MTCSMSTVRTCSCCGQRMAAPQGTPRRAWLEGEFESTADETKGRRLFRRWVASRLSGLPKNHPARTLLLNPASGKLLRALHAGHVISPTTVGRRQWATFAIHEGRSNIRNQTRTIPVKWWIIAPGVQLPVEASDTLPALLRGALRRRNTTTGSARKQWDEVARQLLAAARSSPRRGKRLPVREGEWFLSIS
jgi:hypothetical protein